MSDIEARVTVYLSGGGLFNPELANHDAVRDLIIDLRAALTAARAEERERCAKVCEALKFEWMKGICSHSISDFYACAEAIRNLTDEG